MCQPAFATSSQCRFVGFVWKIDCTLVYLDTWDRVPSVNDVDVRVESEIQQQEKIGSEVVPQLPVVRLRVKLGYNDPDLTKEDGWWRSNLGRTCGSNAILLASTSSKEETGFISYSAGWSKKAEEAISHHLWKPADNVADAQYSENLGKRDFLLCRYAVLCCALRRPDAGKSSPTIYNPNCRTRNTSCGTEFPHSSIG